MNINQIIASELNATEQQIQSAIQLLDEGATVPFIARYRKEATGGLDAIAPFGRAFALFARIVGAQGDCT